MSWRQEPIGMNGGQVIERCPEDVVERMAEVYDIPIWLMGDPYESKAGIEAAEAAFFHLFHPCDERCECDGDCTS